jgi:hypothetical protein
MRPHPDDLDGLDILKNLIDETVLYVDPSRICAGEVSRKLLKKRSILTSF